MPSALRLTETLRPNAFARFCAMTPAERKDAATRLCGRLDNRRSRLLNRLTDLFHHRPRGRRWWRSDAADEIDAAVAEIRDLTRVMAYLEVRYGLLTDD